MSAETSPPCHIVIFGGTGDLALRMLIPSLYHLAQDGLLSDRVNIWATGRQDHDEASYRGVVRDWLEAHKIVPFDPGSWDAFAPRVRYVRLDAGERSDFERLAERLALSPDCDLVAYLSTAPSLYGPICAHLAAVGLTGENTRVALEKPIGHDLASSQVINDGVAAAFGEDRIFRVDHYLGKETVQNLLALRFANALFEPLWTSVAIDHVQITVAEVLGVEGRWSYYDNAGAMRDMLQNHMLQLLCLIAMEPPADLDPDSVRNEKVKVLRSLRPITGEAVAQRTVRGQYGPGAVQGQPATGYREDGGGQASETETFVALRADIDNWRWAGTPFYLRTGKRLAERRTEIVIRFRDVPHNIFAGSGDLAPNTMVISLQPKEEITLYITNKEPGLRHNGVKLYSAPLNLSFSNAFPKTTRRIAYERLLLDIIRGDTTLFVRRDEIEAAWRWVDGIQAGWREGQAALKTYASGSWGPAAAIALAERKGHTWND
ncbi:MAG: glucose-6-phosphate dehydrogenase [Maricaulaceae bacterium]